MVDSQIPALPVPTLPTTTPNVAPSNIRATPTATTAVATVPGNGLAFWPQNWKRDPNMPGLHYEHFFNHYIESEGQYDKVNIANRFIVTNDALGSAKFHSRQYPSINPMNDKDAAIVYVAMTKCEGLADDS
jgi:hypothetical protein